MSWTSETNILRRRFWLRTIRVQWNDLELKYPKDNKFLGKETSTLSKNLVYGVAGCLLVAAGLKSQLKVKDVIPNVLEFVAKLCS